MVLVDSAALASGEALDAATLPAWEGEGWTGYTLSGGLDVDGDGAMDLALSDTTGDVTLLLGP